MDRQRNGLGLALLLLREKKGLRRGTLAREIGSKESLIREYERGQTVPRPETLERLAEALESTVPEIYAFADLLGPTVALQEAAMAARLTRHTLETETLFRPSGPKPLVQELRVPPSAADRRAAPGLWRRLQPYSALDQRAIVLEQEEFHRWALSELVSHESLDAAVENADQAIELAELACVIASLVPGGETWRSRIKGYAGFHLGNAIRVKGNLPSAKDAFQHAQAFWAAGSAGDPSGLLNEVRVLGIEASMLRAERHLTEALNLLDKAIQLEGIGPQIGRFLVMRAKALEEMDRFEEAIATLHQALPRIDPEREPRLLWNYHFNLLVNLTNLGRFAEAEPLLKLVLEQASRFAKGLNRTRLVWLQGRIAAGLGSVREAEAALKHAKAELEKQEIAFDEALVSLELAVLYLQQGRTGEVKALARQMAATFQQQGVERETLAAVLLFRDAADRERATAELARRVADFLRKVQREPGTRFEG